MLLCVEGEIGHMYNSKFLLSKGLKKKRSYKIMDGNLYSLCSIALRVRSAQSYVFGWDITLLWEKFENPTGPIKVWEAFFLNFILIALKDKSIQSNDFRLDASSSLVRLRVAVATSTYTLA